jgi:hypothetical protein
VAGAAQPRPAPPPPRLSSVFGNTVRQIKLKLPQISLPARKDFAALGVKDIQLWSLAAL